MRLDKYLSEALSLTRSESRGLIQKGRVQVNGIIVKKADLQVTGSEDIIANGKPTAKAADFVYIMLNKPKGVVSAAEDKRDVTVVDLVKDSFPRRELFPAGRLDKTSTGFVLLTDDGAFAHAILAPKRHVPKTYWVELDAPVTKEVADGFEKGVVLADGTLLRSASITVDKEDPCKAVVELRQGVYHQIKRMFGVFDIGVNELHRLQIGPVKLDENLKLGEWRMLSDEEIRQLQQAAGG